MSTEQQNTNAEANEVNTEPSKANTVMYTEQQVREIYTQGQADGYIAAIKHVRTEINEYLNELMVSALSKRNNSNS